MDAKTQFYHNRNIARRMLRWNVHLPGDIVMSHSFVQATDGCHYNQCGFCFSYDSPYPTSRIIPLEEVLEDFEDLFEQRLGIFPQFEEDTKRNIFIADADPLVRQPSDILAILGFLYDFEPIKSKLEVVGTYSRADTILRRQEHLAAFREAGLTDIYMGFESGDDVVLSNCNKGYGVQETREAVRLLQEHKYRIHAFVVSGLGGKERTEQHAKKTAKLLNDLNPDTVMVSPLSLSAETPLGQKCVDGVFTSLGYQEKIDEEVRLVEGLDLTTRIKFMGCFRCAEVGIEGNLPQDKEMVLDWLRKEAKGSAHYISCAPSPIGDSPIRVI